MTSVAREGDVDRTVLGDIVPPVAPSQDLEQTPFLVVEREQQSAPATDVPIVFTREDLRGDNATDRQFLSSKLSLGGGGEAPDVPALTGPPESTGVPPPPPAPGSKAEYERKIELLWILKRLRTPDCGIPVLKMSDELWKLELAVQQLQKERQCQDSLETMRLGMNFVTSMLESGSKRAPFNRFLHLEGFHRKMLLDIETDSRWDDAFIALAEKYRKKFPNTSPEFQIALLLGQSVMSYSMANKVTETMLAGMQQPAPPVVPAPAAISLTPPAAPAAADSAAPPAPASTVDPQQFQEFMKMLQARQASAVSAPPVPRSESESSGSRSSRSSRSNKRRSRYEDDDDDRRGRKRRRRSRSDDESSSEDEVLSMSTVEDRVSESTQEEDDEEDEDVAVDTRRRNIPKNRKERSRSRSVHGGDDEAAAVPVVPVSIPEPATVRGGRGGRGGRGARGNLRRPRSAVLRDMPAPVVAPPPTASDEKEDEIDLSGVI